MPKTKRRVGDVWFDKSSNVERFYTVYTVASDGSEWTIGDLIYTTGRGAYSYSTEYGVSEKELRPILRKLTALNKTIQKKGK